MEAFLRKHAHRQNRAFGVASQVHSFFRCATPAPPADRISATIAEYMGLDASSLVAENGAREVVPGHRRVSPLIEGSSLFPRMSASAASERRAPACRRIGPLTSSLDVAAAGLREGGDRFAVAAGVSQLGAALSAERERLVALQEVCARNP
jgi:hypothetical protein